MSTDSQVLENDVENLKCEPVFKHLIQPPDHNKARLFITEARASGTEQTALCGLTFGLDRVEKPDLLLCPTCSGRMASFPNTKFDVPGFGIDSLHWVN